MSCVALPNLDIDTLTTYYYKYKRSIKTGFAAKAESHKDKLFRQFLLQKYNCCYKCTPVQTCNNICYTITERCVVDIKEFIEPTCVNPKKCISITDVTNN